MKFCVSEVGELDGGREGLGRLLIDKTGNKLLSQVSFGSRYR